MNSGCRIRLFWILLPALILFPGLCRAEVDDFIQSFGEPIDPLIKQGLQYFYNLHKDRSNIDRSNEKFTEVLKIDPDNEEALWLISRNYFKKADDATSKEEKLVFFAKAEAYADKCLAVNPDSIPGHMWKLAAVGRSAWVKGILNSLVNVPLIKREIRFILDNSDPSHEFHTVALRSKAVLVTGLPRLLGGDVKEGERLIRRCIQACPRATLYHVDLAENLIVQKKYAEARTVLQRVKNFDQEPFYVWDTVAYDIPRADRLLKEIEGK